VISPLIALMKDQTDALSANGIPATFLNSSIDARTTVQRLDGLDAHRYKLLYVAPERLALAGFLAHLEGWNLEQIAVDEAHCVSEWGHDFRPEYRQIAKLRERYPMVPMLALTATATDRVRQDIERFLQLRNPHYFVSSFNRPNLRYSVFDKRDAAKQLVAYVQARGKESGIVYGQSRQTAEDLAAKLSAAGVRARPYHAGLSAAERARNQELFIRDEVQVICATIAFGMGIDKPNVRFVAHYDIPKNLEGYYQETGRAGRDGLPSECALFFNGGDAAKQRHFITQIEDEHERAQAQTRLREMLDFAASAYCRRVHLLRYFGEPAQAADCGNCDNCLVPPERIDATVAAQKLLSCVYRIRSRSGFSVGSHHVVDVLFGESTDKVLKWGHDRLPIFGIGSEYSKNEWLSFVSELLALGCLEQEAPYRTLALTEEGRTALRERRTFVFAKPKTVEPLKKSRKGRTGSQSIASGDGDLFESLRRLRKELADERGVPPYVVFSDVTLREFASQRPHSKAAFRAISGVGDIKLETYGEIFIDAISRYAE
ncbi:MAG: DNA helicase RecQ, partial [Candidatus Baltobacteraceae bacterium]